MNDLQTQIDELQARYAAAEREVRSLRASSPCANSQPLNPRAREVISNNIVSIPWPIATPSPDNATRWPPVSKAPEPASVPIKWASGRSSCSPLVARAICSFLRGPAVAPAGTSPLAPRESSSPKDPSPSPAKPPSAAALAIVLSLVKRPPEPSRHSPHRPRARYDPNASPSEPAPRAITSSERSATLSPRPCASSTTRPFPGTNATAFSPMSMLISSSRLMNSSSSAKAKRFETLSGPTT